MLLSKSCEYGIRAALYLACQPGQPLTPVRHVSRALGIPNAFLAKVAQALTTAGILHSVRGPRGGVALARHPDEIALADLVRALDGPGLFTDCVLGLPGCGHRRPCPLHHAWADARAHVHAVLSDTSLGAISTLIAAGEYRLSDLPGDLVVSPSDPHSSLIEDGTDRR